MLSLFFFHCKSNISTNSITPSADNDNEHDDDADDDDDDGDDDFDNYDNYDVGFR